MDAAMSSVATITGGRARFPDIRSEMVKHAVREKIGILIASDILQAGDMPSGGRRRDLFPSVSREIVPGGLWTLAAKRVGAAFGRHIHRTGATAAPTSRKRRERRARDGAN
jgi:plasmid stabilization system protein ParE